MGSTQRAGLFRLFQEESKNLKQKAPRQATRAHSTVPRYLSTGMPRKTKVTKYGSKKKRNIDKWLIAVNLDPIAAGGTQLVLLTATYPCTVVSLRWEMAIARPTTSCIIAWCVTILEENTTIPIAPIQYPAIPAAGTAARFMAPERNVMAYGIISADRGGDDPQFQSSYSGSTKTQRKIQSGDQLVFMVNYIGGFSQIVGAFQYFVKT